MYVCVAAMADARIRRPDICRRHVRACAAEVRQLRFVSSHARLPVSWDISGCVLLTILVDTLVREVSRALAAT